MMLVSFLFLGVYIGTVIVHTLTMLVEYYVRLIRKIIRSVCSLYIQCTKSFNSAAFMDLSSVYGVLRMDEI